MSSTWNRFGMKRSEETEFGWRLLKESEKRCHVCMIDIIVDSSKILVMIRANVGSLFLRKYEKYSAFISKTEIIFAEFLHYIFKRERDDLKVMTELIDDIAMDLSEECVREIYAELNAIDASLCDSWLQKAECICARIGIWSPEQIIQEIESCSHKDRIYRIVFTKFEHAWHELGPDLLVMLVNSSEYGERYRLDAAEYLLAEQRPKEAYVMLDELSDEHSNALRVRIIEVMMGMSMGALTAGRSFEVVLQLIEMFRLS
jgi:hypothetical protein